MRIVIPGGSGHLGTLLAGTLHRGGNDVFVLSRSPRAGFWRVVSWDGVQDWSKEIDSAEVVINLAGRSVNCRYTARNRQEVLESRVRSTRAIGAAIAASSRPPRTWLQTSTANESGLIFDHPDWRQAVDDLVRRREMF